MMFDIIKKSGWETLLFPKEMNYPLADFLWGNYPISSKGAKGASPGVKEAFAVIQKWYNSNKRVDPLSSAEQSFYDNVVLPFNLGVKQKDYTYTTVRNIANKHLGNMPVWKYLISEIGNSELTEDQISEWVKGLYDADPKTGKVWINALTKVQKLASRKFRSPIKKYWNDFKKNIEGGQPDSILISPFMYPVTVDLEVMLNNTYGPDSSDKAFTSLIRQALQVQQLHLWVEMSRSTFTFEFRPFESNNFTFADKGNMGAYKNKALSFHLTF
jgi:hypothetical protein